MSRQREELGRLIRARRQAHPEEAPRTSVSTAFRELRGGPPKKDPPELPWPWCEIYPPVWHFGDWMEGFDGDR